MFVTTSARTAAPSTYVTAPCHATCRHSRLEPSHRSAGDWPGLASTAGRRAPGQPGRDRLGALDAVRADGTTHARLAQALADARGQGTVEYVGLVLLVAVLIAGVVKASGGFSDTGIADAVVKKLKGAITGVGEG